MLSLRAQLVLALGLLIGAHGTSFAITYTISDGDSCQKVPGGFTTRTIQNGDVFCIMPMNYVLQAQDIIQVQPIIAPGNYHNVFLATSNLPGARGSQVTIRGRLELYSDHPTLTDYFDGILYVGGLDVYRDTVIVSEEGTVTVRGTIHNRGNFISRGTIETTFMRAQIEQVGKNAGACLTAGGATVDDIVYTTRFVTAPSEFDKHADLLPHYFGPPSAESKTVHEPQLSNPDFLVEVEGIAAIK